MCVGKVRTGEFQAHVFLVEERARCNELGVSEEEKGYSCRWDVMNKETLVEH